MSERREALVALIRAEYDKRPASRYPTEGALADAILAEFDVTPRGEGDDPELGWGPVPFGPGGAA